MAVYCILKYCFTVFLFLNGLCFSLWSRIQKRPSFHKGIQESTPQVVLLESFRSKASSDSQHLESERESNYSNLKSLDSASYSVHFIANRKAFGIETLILSFSSHFRKQAFSVSCILNKVNFIGAVSCHGGVHKPGLELVSRFGSRSFFYEMSPDKCIVSEQFNLLI